MSEQRENNEVVSSAPSDYDAQCNLSPESPCPYLPNRLARYEAYYVEELDPGVYEQLLARSFRRSGNVVYRPRCRNCQECRQIRVPVRDFVPTRSMRRVQRTNGDVTVACTKPQPCDLHFDLFSKYLEHRHDTTMDRSVESFHGFLVDSPTETVEFQYRVDDRLVGVSVADRCPNGLSSIYMYFDPAESRRSLGVFSALYEIEYCRQSGLAYYYLGYHVSQSQKMAYKARFRPHEILVSEGRWIRLEG